MPVLDADAHVIETEQTWDFIDPGTKDRPVLVGQQDQPNSMLWMVDGKLRRCAALFRAPLEQSGPLSRTDVDPPVVDKIFQDNPTALYAL